MAGKELDVFDVREILRRLQMDHSGRNIADEMCISRETVKRYKALANQNGWLDPKSPLPTVQEIQKIRDSNKKPSPATPEGSSVFPYKPLVETLLKESRMTATVIHQRLQERGFEGSYSSVIRFVRHLRGKKVPKGFCRIEVLPGSEAQVDFGYVGKLHDPVQGKKRKAWVFVMTLSHSRHFYAEIVFDQSSWTWLRLHKEAFLFFNGVPAKIVLDNLKAAIIKAAVHDPLVQRSYREMAEHYGFVISPNRPYTPEHKGKVERTILYLKQSFFPGRQFQDLTHANEQLTRWNDEVASMRIHGTTGWRPYEQYRDIEQAALIPIPAASWDASVWKMAKLHPDCHIQVEKSFYSAPFRLIGRKLTMQLTSCEVRIFDDLDLVATHTRALAPRTRVWHKDHLPPEKVHMMMATPRGCLQRAEEVGPIMLIWMQQLLGEGVSDRLRSALAALKLAEKYPPQRIEMACQRSIDFGEVRYITLKRILADGLDLKPWKHLLPPLLPEPKETPRYARDAVYYFSTNKALH